LSYRHVNPVMGLSVEVVDMKTLVVHTNILEYVIHALDQSTMERENIVRMQIVHVRTKARSS